MSLSGKVAVTVNLTEVKAADLANASFPVQKAYEWIVASGVGSGQADLLFSDQRSIVQSANEDLDLAGALAGIFGTTLTLVKCKALGIFAAAANPGNLTVGRGATNGFPWISAVSAGVVIPPGGGNLWFGPQQGIGVTGGTGDLVNVASAATVGTYTYDVIVIGTSA